MTSTLTAGEAERTVTEHHQRHVRVGVGAIVSNHDGKVFLARRGPGARNEVGTWEFPGGGVKFGERLEGAVRRELREEYGMEVDNIQLLGVFDHILADEGQHWVSATYTAEHVGGEVNILEPEKCTDIGWFEVDALPEPLSRISQDNAVELGKQRRDRFEIRMGDSIG